jgi:Xaa-Pro aminopeptidase
MHAVERCILFPGAFEQPMNYKANPYPFRQDSNFLYYFGFSYPGLSGIIDADQGISILVGHNAGMEEVVWMGPQPKMEDRIQLIGAEQTITPDSLARGSPENKVQYLPPYHADRILFLKDLLGKTVEEIQKDHSMDLFTP